MCCPCQKKIVGRTEWRYTELRKSLCMWLREISAWPCLALAYQNIQGLFLSSVLSLSKICSLLSQTALKVTLWVCRATGMLSFCYMLKWATSSLSINLDKNDVCLMPKSLTLALWKTRLSIQSRLCSCAFSLSLSLSITSDNKNVHKMAAEESHSD